MTSSAQWRIPWLSERSASHRTFSCQHGHIVPLAPDSRCVFASYWDWICWKRAAADVWRGSARWIWSSMHGPRVRRSSVVSDPEGALEVMQRQTFILKKLIKHCLVSWEVSQPRNSIIRGEQHSDHVSEGRWPPRCNHTSSRDHRARSQCCPCSERSMHHMHSALISQLLRWQSPGSKKKKKNHSSYWASFVR